MRIIEMQDANHLCGAHCSRPGLDLGSSDRLTARLEASRAVVCGIALRYVNAASEPRNVHVFEGRDGGRIGGTGLHSHTHFDQLGGERFVEFVDGARD